MHDQPPTIASFDQNGTGIKGNIFGLPYSLDEAQLVIVTIPWEVTVSSTTGTASAPLQIIEVSSEIDLFSRDIEEVWKLKIATLEFPHELRKESDRLRKLSKIHIESLESSNGAKVSNIITQKVNEGCENLNIYVKQVTNQLLEKGKMVAILGGDHSTPLGFLRELNERYSNIGVLQIDAHADLRKSYENFTYSHASIMTNVLKLNNVSRIVQVGVRDYCEQEFNTIQQSSGRIKTFFDEDIKANLFTGKTWDSIAQDIVKHLPDLVYISFDIDGLDPKLCPNTGTPVPGGLAFEQVCYLIKQVVLAGKRIIGVDLNEVSGKSTWDNQVGSRVLFQLCTWMAASQGKLRLTK